MKIVHFRKRLMLMPMSGILLLTIYSPIQLCMSILMILKQIVKEIECSLESNRDLKMVEK